MCIGAIDGVPDKLGEVAIFWCLPNPLIREFRVSLHHLGCFDSNRIHQLIGSLKYSVESAEIFGAEIL